MRRPGAHWSSIVENLEALESELLPGKFIEVWVELQDTLPGIKMVSVALLYVQDRHTHNGEGFDLEAIVVVARAPSLSSVLEKHAFPP